MSDEEDDLAFLGERHPLLNLTVDQVARLTGPEREARVKKLVVESYEIFEHGKRELVGDKTLKATCILYSGGNDSTTLAHLFKEVADYAVHANTGIGVEQTRQFVRDTCKGWGLRLIEKHPPPGSTYRDLVLDQGFPGPGHHFKMYQRLKERCLRQVRKDLIRHTHRERVIFLAGRRRSESSRRNQIPFFERLGSTVWISPVALWHKSDLNTYRLMCARSGDPVPRNEVSDNIHMSGECLCGSFAQKDELDMIGFFYPETAAEIRALEADVAATGKFPAHKCIWGWGAYPELKAKAPKREAEHSKSGAMCSSCDLRAGKETVTHEDIQAMWDGLKVAPTTKDAA